MRIGIMGGTLDPVHLGHVQIAMQVMKRMQLDRVMLLPAGDPPHKGRTTPKADRMAMAEIAAEEYAGLFASNVEINREGTTYTVDTLTRLSKAMPENEWVYIVGADTLEVLSSWRCFEKVAGMCTFAAVGRPGSDAGNIKACVEKLESTYGAKIALMAFDGPEISSTDIRKRVAEGRSIEALVPRGVAAYIARKGLYLSCDDEKSMLKKLEEALTPHRFQHTLGVADTAQRLAKGCGVDPMLARLAGLMHDCAKSMAYEAMVSMIREHALDVDDLELENPALVHAPAGMIVARDVYGVKDPGVLSAIRKHTIGDVSMSAMDALIYVSDFIEPGRKPFPGLEKARTMAEVDIFEAARVCAELSGTYVKAQGQPVHPRTQAMIQALEGRLKHG